MVLDILVITEQSWTPIYCSSCSNRNFKAKFYSKINFLFQISCESNISTMELFINNPGLQHIAQQIFLYLDHQSLISCRHVNRYVR